MGNDQRLGTARLQLSLRKSKNQAKKNNYDWSTLQNKNLLEFYTVNIRSRYAELPSNVNDVTEKYGKLIKANSETAEVLIPVKKKGEKEKAIRRP